MQGTSQIPRFGVKIVTVDPKQGLIEAIFRGDQARKISVHTTPTAFRWPMVGEDWIVEQKNGSWYLDSPWPVSSKAQGPLSMETNGVILTVNPANVVSGGTVTVTWSGIPHASPTDWIAVYPAGTRLDLTAFNTTPDTLFGTWFYLNSGTTTAGTSALASGTVSATMPDIPKAYELRLYAANFYTTLYATCGPISVHAKTVNDVDPGDAVVNAPTGALHVLGSDDGTTDFAVTQGNIVTPENLDNNNVALTDGTTPVTRQGLAWTGPKKGNWAGAVGLVTPGSSGNGGGLGGSNNQLPVVRVASAPFISLRDFNPHADSDLVGGGTDDSPTFAAALAAMPTLPSYNGDVSRDRGRTLVVPEGSYRLSSSIALAMSCTRLLGESGSGWHGATKLVADPGVTAINISGGWCSVEDVDLMGNDTALGTNDGIFCNGHGPTLRNVNVDGFFARDGIHIDTDVSGNANNWLLDHVRAAENWRHGLYVSGGDTNAGVCQGACDFSQNREWQVFDHSFLGNSYLGTHVAQSFLGSWTYPVATTLNGGISSTDTTITVASGAALANPDALSAGYIVIGSEWISYAWITGNTLNGCKRGRRGTTAASHLTGVNVTQGYGGYWTRTNSTGGSMFYGCYAESDSPALINNPSMIFGGIVAAGQNDGNALTFTAASSGLRLLPGGDSNAAIVWGSAAPVAGTWTQGSIVYALNPVAGGNIGWVCVTSGTPGTWKTFGTIAA